MPNFGTYEGHRILTDGMNRTMDRAARRYEFEENKRMENAKARQQRERDIESARQFDEKLSENSRQFDTTFGENQRQFNVNDQYNQSADARAGYQHDQIVEKNAIQKALDNQMNQKYEGFGTDNIDIFKDPAVTGEYLTKGLDELYAHNIDVPGATLKQKQDAASQITRGRAQDVLTEMARQFREKGMSQEDISDWLAQNGLTEKMDTFQQIGLGTNPGDPNTNLLTQATYKSDPLAEEALGLKSVRWDDSAKSKSDENQIMKAMKKFKDYSKFQSSAIFDDVDDVRISQNSKGEWTLREKDAVFDDEYKISFDDQGPYVKTGWGNKIYLNNTETFEDLEDLLE